MAGFEDEDDDEYENEAPCEGGPVSCRYPGLKPWAILLDHFMVWRKDEPWLRLILLLLTPHQSHLTSHIRRLSFEFPVTLVDDDVAIGLTGGDHWENMLGVRHHDIEHVTLLRIQHPLQRCPQVFLM